ncbi:serine/threonine-protein kinase [Kitasatospora sp. CM 4170]|uniref:non-specific serine/threonine protein kinase n=1 Tax=Kitasatospora aburaviensis TaxID=67265 RepID=A0ABW1EVD6_9ACTN|nr:serine/threonine-protein kinase [Kitasatospora sp. CM 4170]WNM43711.1 serine/threonine-protein kinase [Kitasatospora sp. CM 4170]
MGRMLAGRYRLSERIGSGGMGVVWRAEDLVLHRPVAVKTIAAGPGVSPESAARLQREARAAAGLSDSPHVVTVHDFGQDGDTLFIVMELVQGRPLDQVLAGDGVPSPARAVHWARQVCAALAFAHERGIVHRDIKPANAILTPDGTVKVLDFGIAWFHPALGLEQLSRTDNVMGSAPWMSPEQARGRDIGPKSDLYSLGCLLHQLLTGNPPFGQRDRISQLVAHASEIPEPPSRTRPGLPPELDTLVSDLLAKLPGQRPASAAEVAARLGAVGELLGSQATAGAPPRPALPPAPQSVPGDASTGGSRKVSRRTVLIGVGVVVTGGATAVVVPKVMDDGGRGKGSGASSGESTGAAVQQAQPRWSSPERYVLGQVGSVLMSGTAEGAVLRDAQSGAMLWQFPDRTKLIRGDALALSTDSVLTVVESKEVRCLDIRTGQIRWSHSLHVGGGEVSDGTHIAAAGTALYVAFARHLWRLDPSNGKVVWTYQLPGDLDILTGLKPATGLLLARNSERAWFAIAPDTGTELWTYPTSSSSEDQTIAGSADGRIYFNGQDEIHVVTAADGKVLAPLKANGQIVPEHGLVVGKSSDATEVAAWSLANGRRLWTAANARVVRMTGTALQLRMIPQGVGNRAIDIRTGSPLWEAEDLRDVMPETWAAVPVAGPWCFAPRNANSDLVLIDPATGRRSRPVRFPQRTLQVAEVIGGTAYATCDDSATVDGYLHNPTLYAVDRPDKL